MNNNHKKFHWYVNVHLRSIYKVIFLNVTERPMKCSIGFIAILAIFAIIDIDCIYGCFNAKQLNVSPIFAICVSIGTMQVSSPCKVHLLIIISCNIIELHSQAICKYICFNDLQEFFKIAQFIEEVYAKTNYQQICSKYMIITERIFQVTRIVTSLVVIAVAMFPLVYYLMTGDMVAALPIYLPEMRSDTIQSLVLVICAHTAMTMIVEYVVYAIDTLIIVIFVNILMVASVIVEEIRQLQTVVKQPRTGECKLRLIKIILMHQKYCE